MTDREIGLLQVLFDSCRPLWPRELQEAAGIEHPGPTLRAIGRKGWAKEGFSYEWEACGFYRRDGWLITPEGRMAVIAEEARAWQTATTEGMRHEDHHATTGPASHRPA